MGTGISPVGDNAILTAHREVRLPYRRLIQDTSNGSMLMNGTLFGLHREHLVNHAKGKRDQGLTGGAPMPDQKPWAKTRRKRTAHSNILPVNTSSFSLRLRLGRRGLTLLKVTGTRTLPWCGDALVNRVGHPIAIFTEVIERVQGIPTL